LKPLTFGDIDGLLSFEFLLFEEQLNLYMPIDTNWIARCYEFKKIYLEKLN